MSVRSSQGFHFKRKLFATRTIIAALLTVLFMAILGSFLIVCPTAYASNPAVWRLVWGDEFDGSSGSAVDSSKWSFDIGGNGWGNNELETYTSRTANADLEGGFLVIKALKETFTGPDGNPRNYTSARLLTKNKFSQAYGRFEARMKIPYGQGIWPAFWMLGDNIDTAHWPNCGEIDIMENIGKEPSIVHGTFHGPGYSGANGIGAAYALSNGQKFSDDFHTFAVEWEPNVMRFYVDGLLYKTRTPADLPAGTSWVFDHPFFIILNVAVGGYWPGNPDVTTVFPQQMLVDYVRVYQRATPSNVPVLFTDENSNRALALDSVTFKRDPFSVRNSYNFSLDHTTRLMLLSGNLDLQPGDGPSIVAAQADDGNGHSYPLAVEWVGRLPNFDWITVVIAKLPDDLLSANQALISVTANNQSSNQVSVSLSP
ncbi:MAG: glycoside hydrolase family 16 protein [Acidobacteriota bacterium]|nr:glycoside hydrolase family 16 protein [Acidobacteriota bacterium]